MTATKAELDVLKGVATDAETVRRQQAHTAATAFTPGAAWRRQHELPAMDAPAGGGLYCCMVHTCPLWCWVALCATDETCSAWMLP